MQWLWAGLLIRSAVILLAAEILRRFPRRSAPASRHRILLAAFGLVLIWPLLSAVIPEIHLPLWPRLDVRDMVTVQQTIHLWRRETPVAAVFHWPVAFWLTGVCLTLLPVIAGYLNVLKVASQAIPLRDSTWTNLLEELCRRQRITKRPELLVLSKPLMPLTFGLRRSRILLPADCLLWTAERRRTVLLHELAHVERRDVLAQLFASVVTALWWFQPLCWTSRWSLRRESERACDALVLAAGVRGSDYAAELLKIAQEFRTRQQWSAAALTMARRGELEERLLAILDPQPHVTALRMPFAAISILTFLTITASAVTLLPRQQTDLPGGLPMKRTLLSGLLASAGLSAATIGGSLFNPNGEVIPNAKASLYNPDTATMQQATTTADGKFVFDDLQAGQYILRVEKPGFASLFREFNVQAESKVERGLTLNLGPAEEKGNAQAAAGERPAYPQSSNSLQLRIGGIEEQAKLITKVQPVYPASAKAARIQGTVELETEISADGVPQEIRVLASPGDDLTKSALEAVRQWRYNPTLLNGQPVEVITDVIVNYTLAP
jgi:TonB family protein